ncbi:MAG: xanthine dehydrogenase family protein molybdopterin-binding subunit, partial [Alphaproteobacteria bacterium]|nr:xanthine dehydrogenase family protein molybdopterin-binding subunit [Alphaproteobacteria bacterium]
MGRGRFVGDIQIQGLQEVAFLRSPIAHGHIRSLAKPQGQEAAVFFWSDMASAVTPIITRSTMPGYKLSSYHPLAHEKVRYVGEALAMCVAASRAEAEDLTEAVTFDIEELPAVTDSEAGKAADSALVHEEWGDNLCLVTNFDSGIDEVAKTAPVKVVREYRTARQCMHPMEGKG